MAERARRPWTLAGRLTRLFLISTAAFIAATAILSALFVQRAIDAQVETLIREELAELRASFQDDPFDRARFDELIAEFAREHAENRMGWRVWNASGVELHEAGATRLLSASTPATSPLAVTHALDDGLRWRTETLGDGTLVGLVFDGSPQYALMKTFQVSVGLLMAGCLVLALIFGRVIFQHVQALLEQVAQRTRAARGENNIGDLTIEGAPVEIQQVVDALRTTLDEIRSESAQARVFTAGLAHELRSPVQNLVGETEIALLAPRDAETYRAVLASHLDELRQLGDAIDNLVTICSKRVTHATGALELFDYAEEAELRLRRDRVLATRESVQLDVQHKGSTLVRGDREALMRALRNVVQNAIHWSPRGGRVAVMIDGGGPQLIVTVEDEGPGVPQELRTQIFEPFFRGPNAPGRRVGYGIGLALARGALEDQQGTIEVERAAGGGARFRMVLPTRVA